MAEVVAINGDPLKGMVRGDVVNTPQNKSLVEGLRKLLEKAEAGEICGVIGAAVYPSDVGYIKASGMFLFGESLAYTAVGALEDAKFYIIRKLNE